ncbi:protein GVQW3-like [Stegodyphus dumicola]|uniref:protein GVQW3-like n=1 Tax=Stegodyphus dumicola TaxID=202533 RepID=UPI0015AC017C|nr:protein GVQW3-like [Stegodyphus dumicola]
MFSKGDQRSWLKIEVACGKNATECYRGLVETCSTNALPYRTAARRVKAFRSGRNETADLQRTGRPSIPQEQIDILSSLLTIDRRWTFRELSLEVGLSHQTVWRIMKNNSLNMRKIASRWVPNRQT